MTFRVKYGIYRDFLLYILIIAAIFPAFAFRDFTLDNELRYMSIADEALRNGDFFTFTNHGLAYADKPPLYIWLVMLGKLIFGTHSMVFMGIFSMIPALVILFVMDRWVKNLVSENDRFIGKMMLITSGYFLGSAMVMRMDMLMCMFIVLSLYTFFRIYSGEERAKDKYMFGVYVFMAIFSKGPIGILVPLLSTVVFLIIKGDIKTIGRYWGWRTLSILISCCGIWFLGVFAEGGSEYLNNLVFNQTVNRAVDSFHHKEPFYYYMEAIWYSLAPWSFLYLGVLLVGLKDKLMKTDLEKFFVIIAVTTFVVLSMVSSKIQIYMLPAFPFFAYIAVLWLPRYKSKKWVLPLVGIPAFLFSLVLPGVVVAGAFLGLSGSMPVLKNFFVISASLVLSATGIYSLILMFSIVHRGDRLNRAITAIAYGMLSAIFLFSFAIPKLNPYIGMGNLCKQAKEQAEQRGVKHYYYYNIKRFENTDVYLGSLPEEIKEGGLKKENTRDAEQPATTIQYPAILFFRDKDLQKEPKLSDYISGKEKYRVGDYYFVIL